MRTLRNIVALLVLAVSAAGAQSVHINDSGTLREITGIHINDAGVLREIQSAWINDNGTLRQVYSSVTVTVSGEVISHSVANGNTATASIYVNTDGTMDKLEGGTRTQIDASTDWRIPNGSGSGYHFKYTLLGTATHNPGALTANTWYELTSDRVIGAQETANDSQESHEITIHISDDGGTTTLDTGAYTVTATVGLPP